MLALHLVHPGLVHRRPSLCALSPKLGYYVRGGPAFKVYLGFYNVIAATTFWILWRKQKVLTHLHRIRIRALIAGNATLALFGTNDMMPLLGIYKYPFINMAYYPTGGVAAIVFGIIVGYSVLQHHLLDIHLTLSRAASYLVQLVFSLVSGFSAPVGLAGVGSARLADGFSWAP